MKPDPILEDRLDDLYQQPLGDFITARNALATERRKAKDADGAARVKALVKPSIPAWAINQLYWNYRVEYDRLMAAGAELGAVQQRGLHKAEGGRSKDLAEATEARRDALAGLLRCAELVLAGHGKAVAPATIKRIESTLEALAAGADSGAAPGRLSEEVEPAGFDALLALAAAAPLPAKPRPREVEVASESDGSADPTLDAPGASKESDAAASSAEDEAAEAEAARQALLRSQAAETEAVERLEACRKAAGEAEATRAAAAARSRQTVALAAEAERAWVQAKKAVERADVALERAKIRKNGADEELTQAEAALAEARAQAKKLRSGPQG